jgi:outer membrane receptor protein involved in Fe transport
MHTKLNSLSRAVRLALSIGLVSSATVYAQDANTDKKADSKETKTLQAIEVTGSLVRRVDTETASPVVTLSREQLTNTGNPTLGNALQALPSFSGYATNPQNNSNGGGVASPTLEGGDGASRLSLRGMGDNRTLLLVDGHRLANPDINMLPANMIGRVDVLASGATTTYGSDAIGGVANFILRKDFSGLEVSANGGVSGHGDGQRHGIDLTVGATGDQGNIVGGLDYNKYNPVLATARSWSAQQIYLYSYGAVPEGSHSIPTGRIVLPANNPLIAQLGCSKPQVTRGSGDGTSLSDYRCFGNASDFFNYQAFNYIQTNQERINAFVLGNYKINDALTYYADFFYNHTDSSGQDGPSPTNVGDGWSVPASNPNNPFGIDFCNSASPNCPAGSGFMYTRLTGAGPRLHTYATSNIDLITGLRGVIGQTSWIWDLGVNYGHSSRDQKDYHELNVAGLQAAIDAGGNPFDQSTLPVTITNNPVYSKSTSTKEATFNASGEMFNLPAGAAQLSVGALYRKQSMDYQVTSDAILDLSTLNCAIAAEGCGSPGHGSIEVKEVFGEALFPLVVDAPLAKSLNLDVGVRTSDYDLTGSTTNWKAAIEWKPIDDLLVRGTATQVFRAPTPDEAFDGPTLLNPTVSDPCVNQSASYLAAHPNLCQNVAANWQPPSYGQITSIYQGGSLGNGLKLRAEHGKSYDFGFVYSPSWAEGLSSTLDFWHITLNDLLTPLAAQTALDNCAQNDASPYCGLITRYGASAQAGAIYYIVTPQTNLGSLSTSGVDFNVAYALPHFDIGSVDPGNFKATFYTTYTSNYKVSIPGGTSGNYVGTYSDQYGNISRLRATLALNWKLGNWSAQWQTRFVNSLTLLNAFADGAPAGTPNTYPMASATYHAVKVGYEIPSIKTTFDLGVDNLTDRRPPLIYQHGAGGGGSQYNADVTTYDTLGQYIWGRVTVKF